MPTVTVCFTIDSDRDRDLVRWLDSLPKRKRSEAIREVLHTHLCKHQVTLSDIYQAVRDVDRKLASGAIIVGTSDIGDTMGADEPLDVAAALDSLGL